MGAGLSSAFKKPQSSVGRPAAANAHGLSRVQYIEHRRRSSIIDMDVEKMMGQPDNKNSHGLARGYRPTMKDGSLAKGASAAAENYNNSNSRDRDRDRDRPLSFSTGVEVYTRPMTLQKDKQTLHYTRQELFKMQQDAEEEDESFSIVGVKIEDDVVVYGIRWLDEDGGAIEWIKRQEVYEAGPTMLCEYESIHQEELMLMSAKLEEVLKKAAADKAEVDRLKREREKVLATAKAKAQAELRDLEGSDDAAPTASESLSQSS